MMFNAAKSRVLNRGIPSDEFLKELVEWGQSAPEEIFARNDDPEDVFIRLAPILGPWTSVLHRRCGLLELLRVLAGFESSWNWNEGVDTTNQTSMKNIEGRETGIFQVSFDSLRLDDTKNTGDDLHQCVMKYCGALDIHKFLDLMKSNHTFALEYGARLLRNSFYWDGPVKRHEIDRWLLRDAVHEFELLLRLI